MSAWNDDCLLLSASDGVICKHVNEYDEYTRRVNGLLSRKPYADVQKDGSSLGPRCEPAPCGVYPQKASQADLEALIPNGFLLDVCPKSSYANQMTYDDKKACTRSHQTFLNSTKRGTGAVMGTNRGMTR